MGRSISNCAGLGPFRDDARGQCEIVRRRSRDKHLDLSANYHNRFRNFANQAKIVATEDEKILKDMLLPVARGTADTISKRLINEFGSLPKVLSASLDANNFDDLPKSVIQFLMTMRQTISRVLRRDVLLAPILSNNDALMAYLHHEMSSLSSETVRVLFLNTNNQLIHEQIMWEGTLASVQFHPREIIRLAIRQNASALIIVHNHPDGCVSPSAADIKATQELTDGARCLDIVVHDHLIISNSGYLSMRAEGWVT